jgi:hypothetical protein
MNGDHDTTPATQQTPAPSNPMLLMNDILDKLLAAAPEEQHGAIEAQLRFRNGVAVAGSVRRGDLAGTYVLTTIGQQALGPEGRGGQTRQVIVEMFFLGIDLISIERFKEKTVDLSLPAGTIIPGIGGRR